MDNSTTQNQPLTETPVQTKQASPSLFSKYLPIIVIALIAGVIGSAGTYFALNSKTKPQPISKINTTTTPTPDPTANWQTYVIPDTKIEFRYPEDLYAFFHKYKNIGGLISVEFYKLEGNVDTSVFSSCRQIVIDGRSTMEELGRDDINCFNTLQKGNHVFSISGFKSKDKAGNKSLKEQYANDNSALGVPIPEFYKDENGRVWTIVQHGQVAGADDTVDVDMEINNEIFHVNFAFFKGYGNYLGKLNSKIDIEKMDIILIKQILSTFKFTW